MSVASAEPLNPEIQRIRANITAGMSGNLVLRADQAEFQAGANIALLEKHGEVGQCLISSYLAAIDEEPVLKTVLLREGSGEEKSVGVIPRFYSDSGLDEVKFSANEGWDFYSKQLGDTGRLEKVAKKLGIAAEEIDAPTLAVIQFGHELGHVVYDQHFQTREEYELARTSELRPLLKLLDNPEASTEAKRSAYRNMPSEEFADGFAVLVVQRLRIQQTQDTSL